MGINNEKCQVILKKKTVNDFQKYDANCYHRFA